ncbi:MAG: GNAT family N-acetyltransferase [Candidatus Jordarchaeaceae archaeon]
MGKRLHITEINEIDQFFGLRDKWNEVLERSKDGHVLLTWEFMSTYVKHFGKERKLKVLYIEDKNRIIAIAPLRLSRYNFAGSFGYNVIEPLAFRHADYTGFILAEREVDCLKLFLNYLFEQDDWDFIYLYDIPGTSIISELLPKISTDIPSTFEFTKGVVCPYMVLPESMDVLMNKLSKNFRYNLRRYMKKLEKDYQRVELKRYDELGSVEEAMQIFIHLHQKRWNLKGMPGVYDTQKRRNFGLEAAKVLADKGWLVLYFLTVNDQPIAGLYCLEYNHKMYGGLSGFDPNYTQYSVGNLIIAKVIEKCIEKRIKEFDFMKGAEPYKFNWTTNYRRNFNVRFVNKNPTSNIYNLGIKAIKQMGMDKIFGKFLEF